MMPMSLSRFSLNLVKCHADKVQQRPLLGIVGGSMKLQALLLEALSLSLPDVGVCALILWCTGGVDGSPAWRSNYLLFHSGDH